MSDNQGVAPAEQKMNFKFTHEGKGILPYSSFSEGDELLLKWKASLIEETTMQFAIGKANGLVLLGWPELRHVGTRLAFTECSPEILTSPAHFHITTTCRNIILVGSQLFIRSGEKTYCLYRQKVGIHLTLPESSFYKLKQAVLSIDSSL